MPSGGRAEIRRRGRSGQANPGPSGYEFESCWMGPGSGRRLSKPGLVIIVGCGAPAFLDCERPAIPILSPILKGDGKQTDPTTSRRRHNRQGLTNPLSGFLLPQSGQAILGVGSQLWFFDRGYGRLSCPDDAAPGNVSGHGMIAPCHGITIMGGVRRTDRTTGPESPEILAYRDPADRSDRTHVLSPTLTPGWGLGADRAAMRSMKTPP